MRTRLITAVFVTAQLAFGFAACQQTPENEANTEEGTVIPEPQADHDEHANHDEHSDHGEGMHEMANNAGTAATPTEPAVAPAGTPELAATTPVAQPGAQIGDTTNCPVCDAEFTLEERHTHFDHDGETYYFCCPHCLGDFRNDPGQYVN